MAKKTKRLSQEIVNTFIDFLEEENEPRLLREVAQEMQNIANVAYKHQKILITSAVKLDESEKKKVQSFFKSILNEQYPLINIVKPEILGGMQVKWGDFMLDMTLRARLAQLRNRLQ